MRLGRGTRAGRPLLLVAAGAKSREEPGQERPKTALEREHGSDMSKKSAGSEIERLVHSLEHGHTILWYDETVKPGTDAYKYVQQIADKFDPETDKFMAAPWNTSDGGSFPSGKHIAFTHWTGPDKQKGETQYCKAPSGGALGTFMKKSPASSAPEPAAP